MYLVIEVNDMIKFESKFYNGEVKALKQYGYKLEVSPDAVFQCHTSVLLATKKSGFGDRISQVSITGHFAPTHFYTFIIKSNEGYQFELSTGSGSLEEYLPDLDKAIGMIQTGMLTVKKIEVA
jgi:hypothetical protein